MSLVSIIIVESEIAFAEELKKILQGLGYKVAGTANSASESMKLIEELKPSIVLMNINLRKRHGGMQTGSLIRKQHDLPVVYIIDKTSQDTIRRAGTTGPFGYIFKPFEKSQIFATIETALLRHLLEKKLQESHQWLNTILTNIGDGVVATDENGFIRFINPAATELTGWQEVAAIGKSFYEIFSLFDEKSNELMNFSDIRTVSTEAGARNNFIGLLYTRTGRSVLVEAKIAPIQDNSGLLKGMVLTFRDITQQREATLEIKRQADRAEALLQAASQLSGQRDLEKVLLAICEITNRTLKAAGTAVFLRDATKNIFRDRTMVSDDEKLKAYSGNRFEIPSEVFRTILSYQNPVVLISDIKKYHDSPYLALFEKLEIKSIAIAALFQEESLSGALISVFKENDRHPVGDEIALLKGLADQALSSIENAELFEQVRAGRERQKKLAKSLVDVQELERRHIARELHDQLGQALTGLQFMLETTKNQADETQKLQLLDIQKYVGDIIMQVREMSLNLRPSMLDDMGLLPTLQWHFDRFTNQTGIKVKFNDPEIAVRLPSDIETASYRIVQEALTNIARYAQVKDVVINLAVQKNTLLMEVIDQGKGFEATTVIDKPTSGLSGMRERAMLVGGSLTIKTGINLGTQIYVELPLTDKPIERRKHDRIHSSRG